MAKKEVFFSKHYKGDKDIDPDLAEDCIHTGKKEKEKEETKLIAKKKYRKGELIVVFRDMGEYDFFITAFWNSRGGRQP